MNAKLQIDQYKEKTKWRKAHIKTRFKHLISITAKIHIKTSQKIQKQKKKTPNRNIISWSIRCSGLLLYLKGNCTKSYVNI